MIADLSKIPSSCTFILWSGGTSNDGSFACTVNEKVGGRSINATGWGNSPQEAIDKAVASFLRGAA